MVEHSEGSERAKPSEAATTPGIDVRSSAPPSDRTQPVIVTTTGTSVSVNGLAELYITPMPPPIQTDREALLASLRPPVRREIPSPVPVVEPSGEEKAATAATVSAASVTEARTPSATHSKPDQTSHPGTPRPLATEAPSEKRPVQAPRSPKPGPSRARPAAAAPRPADAGSEAAASDSPSHITPDNPDYWIGGPPPEVGYASAVTNALEGLDPTEMVSARALADLTGQPVGQVESGIVWLTESDALTRGNQKNTQGRPTPTYQLAAHPESITKPAGNTSSTEPKVTSTAAAPAIPEEKVLTPKMLEHLETIEDTLITCKDRSRFTVEDIVRETGISRVTVLKALGVLEERERIDVKRSKQTPRLPNYYSIRPEEIPQGELDGSAFSSETNPIGAIIEGLPEGGEIGKEALYMKSGLSREDFDRLLREAQQDGSVAATRFVRRAPGQPVVQYFGRYVEEPEEPETPAAKPAVKKSPEPRPSAPPAATEGVKPMLTVKTVSVDSVAQVVDQGRDPASNRSDVVSETDPAVITSKLIDTMQGLSQDGQVFISGYDIGQATGSRTGALPHRVREANVALGQDGKQILSVQTSSNRRDNLYTLRDLPEVTTSVTIVGEYLIHNGQTITVSPQEARMLHLLARGGVEAGHAKDELGIDPMANAELDAVVASINTRIGESDAIGTNHSEALATYYSRDKVAIELVDHFNSPTAKQIKALEMFLGGQDAKAISEHMGTTREGKPYAGTFTAAVLERTIVQIFNRGNAGIASTESAEGQPSEMDLYNQITEHFSRMNGETDDKMLKLLATLNAPFHRRYTEAEILRRLTRVHDDPDAIGTLVLEGMMDQPETAAATVVVDFKVPGEKKVETVLPETTQVEVFRSSSAQPTETDTPELRSPDAEELRAEIGASFAGLLREHSQLGLLDKHIIPVATILGELQEQGVTHEFIEEMVSRGLVALGDQRGDIRFIRITELTKLAWLRTNVDTVTESTLKKVDHQTQQFFKERARAGSEEERRKAALEDELARFRRGGGGGRGRRNKRRR